MSREYYFLVKYLTKLMGTASLNSLSAISTNDCCTLLLTCSEKSLHVGSATFTTENFKCRVCLKKFSLKK